MVRTSMKDVAKRAGVAPSTVSNIINKRGSVKPDTLKRVNAAIEELDYKINPIARNLRSGRSNIIGFLVANLTDNFYIEIGKYIERIVQPKGYRLFYIDSDDSKEKEISSLEMGIENNFAGFIISAVNDNWNNLSSLIQDTPVVFIDRKPLLIRRDVVLSNNMIGCFELTNQLISWGAKNLVFLGFNRDSTIEERRIGFEDALEQNNFPYTPEKCIFKYDTYTPTKKFLTDDSWFTLLDTLIMQKDVDGIICSSGILGYIVYKYCKKHFLVPQKDLYFGTFDKSSWMDLVNDKIAVSVQNQKQIGQKATEFLLARLENEKIPYYDTVVDTKLEIFNV